MACPTCDHTMAYLDTERVVWCPICGTVTDALTGESSVPLTAKELGKGNKLWLQEGSYGRVPAERKGSE